MQQGKREFVSPRRYLASLCGGALLASSLATSALAFDVPLIAQQETQRQAGGRTPLVSGAVTSDTRLRVARIDVEGGSVFDYDVLTQSLWWREGSESTLGELRNGVESITRRYREAGYPLSYAYLAEDGFEDGVFTVVVVEGYIARVQIEVENPEIARRVEALSQRLIGERPLTQASLERYVALMEAIPGAHLAVSVPLPRTPGGATTLRVEERRPATRLEAGLRADLSSEEAARLLLSMGLPSPSHGGEALSFQALLPLEDDDEFYALDYRRELGTDGLRLNLGASRDDRELEGDGALELGGAGSERRRSERLRLGLDYPLLLTRDQEWRLGGNLEHHRQRQALGGGEVEHIERDLDVSVAALHSQWHHAEDGRVVRVRGELRQGVDLGGNRRRASAPIPWSESLHFLRLGSELEWVEALDAQWRLIARGAAFWSDDSLPAGERGGFGGSHFGRAYAERQAEGDYGYAGELQLRYLQRVELPWATSLEPYLVADGARTGYNARDLARELGSGGFGVEVVQEAAYRLSLEYARPFGDGDLARANRDGRINARLIWRFDR